MPLISVPFNWLESYFHELSHGLAALVTGGRVVQIQLFPNGAGLCTTQGGMRFVISLMGYLGATLFGYFICRLAQGFQAQARWIYPVFIALMTLSLILWVRDVLTAFIIGVLIALFVVKWRFVKSHSLGLWLKFTGIIVLLNSVYSPLYLIDGRHLGDGASLASMTFIPEIIWALLWSASGIFALYLLIKKDIIR